MELATRDQIEADLTRQLAEILDRWRQRYERRLPEPEEVEEDERNLFLWFIVALSPVYYAGSRQIIDEFHAQLPQGAVISHRKLQAASRKAAEERAAFVADLMARGTSERAADYRARMAQAVQQFRDSAAEGSYNFGADLEVLVPLRVKLDWEFSHERAELVAITETTAAQFGGYKIGQDELRERGVILEAIWWTREDELVCSVCLPLNGTQESDWPEKYRDGPPAHVRCRCAAEFLTEAETIAEEANT